MKFDAIAAEVGCSERDITYFYKRHRFQYQLDQLVNPVKKAIFEPPPPADSPSVGQLTRSASPTPEPIPRRKRAGSDPAYCERNEAPPTKSTRRTRQSAATLLESN
uniref:Homeobox domain-containing protein n=1 Tax=Heterorhabditis bacteriophora TaxID=37862 RepID=A0A1I7XL96_HETBA